MYFKALGLHGHDDEHDDEHDHAESEPHNIDFVWKGVVVLVGLYVFFLLEVALHGLGDYLKRVRKRGGAYYYSQVTPVFIEV